MRYKPERALTQVSSCFVVFFIYNVEMRYKPERALTPNALLLMIVKTFGRNEV